MEQLKGDLFSEQGPSNMDSLDSANAVWTISEDAANKQYLLWRPWITSHFNPNPDFFEHSFGNWLRCLTNVCIFKTEKTQISGQTQIIRSSPWSWFFWTKYMSPPKSLLVKFSHENKLILVSSASAWMGHSWNSDLITTSSQHDYMSWLSSYLQITFEESPLLCIWSCGSCCGKQGSLAFWSSYMSYLVDLVVTSQGFAG